MQLVVELKFVFLQAYIRKAIALRDLERFEESLQLIEKIKTMGDLADMASIV